MEHDRQGDEKLDAAVEDMQSDADEMQERSEKLSDRIDEVRSDWRSKQQDDAVPGAQPPLDDEAGVRPAGTVSRARRSNGVRGSHDSDSSSSPSAAISSRFAE